LIYDITQPLLIGADFDYGELASPFVGSIDDVRIWPTARSEDEVRLDMNVRGAGDVSGPAACWLFDEGTGQIAHDASPNGNNGQRGSDRGVDLGAPQWVAVTR
jgi:hypothetical protein